MGEDPWHFALAQRPDSGRDRKLRTGCSLGTVPRRLRKRSFFPRDGMVNVEPAKRWRVKRRSRRSLGFANVECGSFFRLVAARKAL